MKFVQSTVAALALLLAAASPAQQASSTAADRVRADVEFLASDQTEGRATGSRGYDVAAAYVAAQFRAIGLKPAGTDGSWYQQVPFRRAVHAVEPQAVAVIGNEVTTLRSGADFSVRPSLLQQVRTIDAPLVFAGHGISDAQAGIDDYAGLDVRGKIVLVLEGTPPRLPTELAAHLESAKSLTAAGKGAVGLLEIGSRNRLAWNGRPVVDWVAPSGTSASQWAKAGLVGAVSRNLAEKLFAAAGQSFSSVRSAASRPGSLSGFNLPARLRLSDRAAWTDFRSPEVVGMLPGSDPALKGEHVVLMAHLDHLGARAAGKPGEDRVFNGALDNAAGVATMLEAAREFVASGRPPRRSVLFIANTGEEDGLRGADYFAAHPTVPQGSIVGLVDLDMPILLYDFTDIIAFGGDHSTVGRAVAEAAQSMGLKVSPDPMPEQAIFTRSDHYRFVTRGTPAVLLATGYANGGEAAWKRFFARTYHREGDDLSLPIRWDQGARFATLNYRIARRLADSDQRPLWYQGDYFGESFAPGQPRAPR